MNLRKTTDVVVVGAGHAGCEAALACARLGLSTVLFTVSVESIALMPCNPSVGGSSKGHLVREVDALGGEMGKNIDATFIQSRMLNVSKGPAVHSLRAQADKAAYTARMRKILENTDHLVIRQAQVAEILTEVIGKAPSGSVTETLREDPSGTVSETLCKDPSGSTDGTICKQSSIVIAETDRESDLENACEKRRITGIRTTSGAIYECKAVILCTGTYLNARCIYGDVSTYTGPNGLQAATYLTDSMRAIGITLRRFKTGTPARIDKRSIDFSKLEAEGGDEKVVPFSFETDPEQVQIKQDSVFLAYTNEKTHEIIRENLDRSPLFSGMIEGTGPRYCPSIEDKVVRFPDRERHQIFVEPEGRYTNEMYLSGMSSSLPEDVQEAMYRSMEGFEHAHIVRNAYAIEYDCIDATQLKPSLEFKQIDGCFSAGQLNGSSGYEEAAAQGIMAGINAAMYIKGRPALVIDRSEGYIGVLIDDLVTKETSEPYRMMTSRAEYSLLLRQDNADMRLTKKGHDVGLISDARYEKLLCKEKQIETEIERLGNLTVGASSFVCAFLESHGSTALNTGVTMAELIRRPELNYDMLREIDPDRPALPEDVREEVNILIKYEGYIRRQEQQVRQFRKNESLLIPEDIDYDAIGSLRIEARQKLKKIRPESIGRALRISGVSPADVSVLMVYLKQKHAV